uniref:MipA/OmpV family protein n=1 Tax=Thaumasiovibrio subtropicus TaxID=1891207 RepID=UPI001864EC10|nr:MipA/OmpV family protein [Thaumasiovibrio subtropicus]
MLASLLALGSAPVLANTTDQVEEVTVESHEEWGVAAGFRVASIPFDTADSYVTSFIPMVFYRNDWLEINGTEGHITAWKDDSVELNALLRMRFIDLPKSLQNAAGGDTADAGVQLRYGLSEQWHVNLEAMWDLHSRMHSNLTLQGDIYTGDWQIMPNIGLRHKTRKFSEHYFGGIGDSLSSGFDVTAGVDVRYHVYSNLYLLGGAQLTYLDSSVQNSSIIDSDFQSEVFLGFGIFNNPAERGKALDMKSYWRASYGFATPSNMGDILAGNWESDPDDNRMSSLFYGHPIADNLFGYPLDLYFSPGLAWHHKNDEQATGLEYVLSIKAYKTFTWPVRWRLGVGEGLSYVNKITQVEQKEMDEKGYKPSKLLNYIDLSLDVNVGDVFNKPSWDHVWFGYSMHHRSAIFESASQFGRIKGGSNYNTLYLQWDF